MYNPTGSSRTSIRFILFTFFITLVLPAVTFAVLKGTGLYVPTITHILDFICIVLIFLYIRIVDTKGPVDYLRLSRNALKGLGWGSFFSLLILLGALIYSINSGNSTLNIPDSKKWAITPLLIGLFQEIPFRGFIQRHLERGLNIVSAIVLTSILFVLYYYVRLSFSVPMRQVLLLFVMSVLLGIIVHQTRSLWSAILINSVLNFTLLVILG